LLATIPYKTFPKIALGPLELRTFGVMVGIGVLLGAWVAARYIEQHTGVIRDETYRLATRLVVGGVIGARITWDLSHTNQIDSPLDLIAVWKGGLQFSGGFIAAVLIGFPTFRRWSRSIRWSNLDGYAYGLTLGLAFGRVGCTSVGEHFGWQSDFFLAVDYRGGATPREPAVIGQTFHNTAIYELVYLLVLFALLSLLIRRRPAPGTVMGVFCLFYGTARFLSDFLRVNDKHVWPGLTGAQYLMLAVIVAGIWITARVRKTTSIDDLIAPEPVLPEPSDGEPLESTP
jgi:phosphatidylglycerol:prolipoprotein diacylglycerol transferase